jgi:hypothetical protein
VIKSFIVGVLVSLCICLLRVNHGAFNEILRILFRSLCSLLKFCVAGSKPGDECVMIGRITDLYNCVVHSCLRGYSLNKHVYALFKVLLMFVPI